MSIDDISFISKAFMSTFYPDVQLYWHAQEAIESLIKLLIPEPKSLPLYKSAENYREVIFGRLVKTVVTVFTNELGDYKFIIPKDPIMFYFPKNKKGEVIREIETQEIAVIEADYALTTFNNNYSCTVL